MKKLTALLTSMMMMICMAATPVQAEHTFENARTDEYCKELLVTCSDCYTLDADGVYTYTNCVYHTGTNMFDLYVANPGTYDRSDLLLSLARIHPESKYLVKISLYGESKDEVLRLKENGIDATSANAGTLYAVMTAEQVENFPASEKVGYLLSLSAPLEEVLPDTVRESMPNASEEGSAFNEEKFFVVVGTYSGGYTQLRYLYPTSSGAYTADKVILSDDTKYAYGDVLTCKGDAQMTRVQSAPDDPVYAMAYHYSIDENADLTKEGNCKDLLEKKVLTVTDAVYDGSGHWSYHLADATGTEYYYGLNIFGSSLDVSLSEANIGDAVTFAMYRDTPAIPLSIGEVKESPQTAAKQGDLNGDGVSDIMDVIRLNKALLGVEQLTDAQSKAADLDSDGKMTSNDALVLLKQILGITEQEQHEATLNLAASYAAQPVQTVDIDEQTVLGQTKFALDLLRESAEPGKNSLVSPYSVSQALGMTANGAAGNTLKEMETVLGGSMDTLNPAFYTLRTRDTKDAKCVTANSIWMKDSYIQEYPVSKAFLQTNADYYGADAFAAPFDETTLADINGWVNDKTDQMIPSIIEEIPNDAVMYLVNAVAFDAEWEQPYSTDQESTFTAADGTEQTVKMLCRDDFGRPYYQDEHAIGFRQDYKGGAYYFAAFLPEEGMTPEAYLDTLKAESLQKMLSNPASGKIYSEIPEFSYDYSIKLKDPLSTIGMPSAFVEGEESDFSRMAEDGEDNLFIKDVFHKTHIEVTKMGTRAGASTAVEMWAESSPIYIRLNRPFLYMIADSETNLPVFIGIVNSVQ
ncbi:MAG: hypothetical protein IJ906_00880 [Oscillospiraceae bacterium]|nr:hypothetical protein [Oscillospiraceae bacterium]